MIIDFPDGFMRISPGEITANGNAANDYLVDTFQSLENGESAMSILLERLCEDNYIRVCEMCGERTGQPIKIKWPLMDYAYVCPDCNKTL